MSKNGRPVRTQMPSSPIPGMTSSKGTYDRGKAPFDKPHDTGNGGIPVKIFHEFPGQGTGKRLTPTQVSPAGYPSKGTGPRRR